MKSDFHLKVWGSLTEPRFITAMMVAIYLLVAASGIILIADDKPDPVDVNIAAVLMIIGGILGMPSAWRGSWWLEGPAALLSVIGMSIMSLMEILATASSIGWPHHTLTMALISLLFFGTRALRVWPEMYRPGTVPVTQVEIARARMQGAQEAERIAASSVK